MVEISEILPILQSISSVATALGVCIAAAYYILNLRNTQKNMQLTLDTRRVDLIVSLTSRLINAEGRKAYQELINYEWKNYDDFERKYGSDFDIESSSKRYATWFAYNSIGLMIRRGMVSSEDIYDMGMFPGVFLWEKYKSVIEEIRKRYFGNDYLKDLELLSKEMMRIKLQRDPQYKVPESFTKYIPDK